MIKWKFKDKSEQITRTSLKAKAIIGVVLCAMLISIFTADDWQQKRFAILQYGYCSMEQRQYEEAIVAFKEYLNVDSDIYWYLIEYSNNENYSRKKVKECLEKCMLLQKNIRKSRGINGGTMLAPLFFIESFLLWILEFALLEHRAVQ